ncbi:THAP domain-containing protein, partial [Ooceraea biroi]
KGSDIPLLDYLEASTSSYVANTEIQNERESQETQTDLTLSRNSPRKQLLKRRIVMLQRKIYRLQKKEINKNKVEMEDSSIEHYFNLTDHFLPPSVAKFVKNQALLHQQSKKGRKYTAEYKEFCLNIYFCNAKCYDLLSETFYLPTKRTLQRMIISSDIYCILCIDEASLKASLFYNISRDEVIGFEDVGNGKSFSPSCNVAVLMIRGMCRSWKQPLGYYFLHSTFPADQLKLIITEAISKLQGIGLKVVALITDMGSNFIQTAKLLKVTESPYFIINNKHIAYFFDPPHLQKACRNNFLNNVIIANGKQISWTHIEQLYAINSKKENRLAPKLTDSHMRPTNFERMKV